jgi:hypothetical protein
MLKTVLEPQVRHAINRWYEERPGDGKPDEVITEKDWETIEKVSPSCHLILGQTGQTSNVSRA